MHLSHLLEVNMILLVVMLGTFAVIDRYAKRHPYGTGHFGKMERKRRAHEARRKRVEQPNGQAKARNEAVMAAMLAPPRAGGRSRTAAKSDHGSRRRGQP